MTKEKKKALMVYGLGIFCVVLAVTAGYLNRAYGNCGRDGGEWKGFYCSR